MHEIAVRKNLTEWWKSLFDWAVLEKQVYWLYEIHEDWK